MTIYTVYWAFYMDHGLKTTRTKMFTTNEKAVEFVTAIGNAMLIIGEGCDAFTRPYIREETVIE